MPLEFPQHSLDSFPARGLGCSDSISDLSKFEPHSESKKAILAIQREEFLNGTALKHGLGARCSVTSHLHRLTVSLEMGKIVRMGAAHRGTLRELALGDVAH